MADAKLDSKDSGTGCAVIVALLFVVAFVWGCEACTSGTPPAKQEPAKQSFVPPPYNAADIIHDVRLYVSQGKGSEALEELGKLRPDDAKFPDRAKVEASAKRMAKTEEALNEKQKAAAGKQERIEYAAEYERSLLEASEDAYIRAQGPNAETLYIRHILINRPFVYNLMNDRDLTSTWRAHGFKKVIFTDGFETTWTDKLD